MKLKIRELCATILALLAAHGLFAVNVSADAQTEKGRIRLAERDVLVFADDGTLTVNAATTVELLMVGGGGGGGVNRIDAYYGYQGGAGGGAGGVIHKQALTLMPGDYSIVIGEGGEVSANGGDTKITGSSDFVLTAFGGGAGADWGGNPGKSGGSGGGSTLKPNTTDYKTAGQPVGGDNLGFAGGVASHQYGAGGGGGATAAGETPTGSTPGKGGDGYGCAIVGTNVWYGGGGAGFRNKQQINGGLGGGGSCIKAADGQSSAPSAGVDGLGGGGCGGSKGGKGVVIVSFVSDTGSEVDSDDFRLSGGDKCIPMLEDTVLIFRQSGSLNVSGSGLVEVLLVGGGGGGGTTNAYGAGGGGAGGVVHRQGVFLNEGTYDIVVGAGGEIGADGLDTSAFGFRALGGGAGSNAGSTSTGRSGGSGGGATYDYNKEAYYPFFAGAAAIGAIYGNMGHAGGGTANLYGAGGGGGAGAPGEPQETPSPDMSSTPGAGGDGYCCSITGVETWYGGGGTGYRGNSNNTRNTAVGGKGGGGASVLLDGNRVPGPGTDGLGGGGCGGAKGGSGLVIVRYHKASYVTRFEGAEGGEMTQWRSFRIHTFAEDGTFTMPTNGMVEVLLVGGGGGGGECLWGKNSNYQGGAGGGAGGVVHVTNLVLASGPHEIKIGAGGEIDQNGENTTAFDLVAYGGGAGARYDDRSEVTSEPYGRIGSNGGSGGGSTHARRDTMPTEPIPGGLAAYSAEGNLGHDGGICTHVYGASGGGGAGGAGGNTAGASGSSPGCGGVGIACSITGREVYYAGGGAGYRNKQQADGGLGGGGSCVISADGASSAPSAGVDGLGGGGCGGAAGGKGVVIIRYCFRDPPGTVLVIR